MALNYHHHRIGYPDGVFFSFKLKQVLIYAISLESVFGLIIRNLYFYNHIRARSVAITIGISLVFTLVTSILLLRRRTGYIGNDHQGVRSFFISRKTYMPWERISAVKIIPSPYPFVPGKMLVAVLRYEDDQQAVRQKLRRLFGIKGLLLALFGGSAPGHLPIWVGNQREMGKMHEFLSELRARKDFYEATSKIYC